MKKQYIKPFVNIHVLKAETAVLAASYPVKATDNDKTQSPSEGDNYGIKTEWDWGNGNDSDVD